MPQQLFLFDDEREKGVQSNKKVDNQPNLLSDAKETDEAESLSTIEFDELAIVAEQGFESSADPFAEVQQKQQDKIDTLLLMPNKKRGRKSFKDMDEESILIDVPPDEVLFQKKYYRTSIVAEWLGVTQSQLRAWETEFDILAPKKNGKGDRYFRPEDVKNLKLIYHLLRVRKFTVQGAKQYLLENKKKVQNKTQLIQSLQNFKQFLLELKAISG